MLYGRAAETFLHLGGENVERAFQARLDLAGVLRKQGKHEENLALLRELCSLKTVLLGAQDPEVLKLQCRVGEALLVLGKADEALEAASSVLEKNAEVLEENSECAESLSLLRGQALRALGRFQEADPVLQKLYQVNAARAESVHMALEELPEEVAGKERE